MVRLPVLSSLIIASLSLLPVQAFAAPPRVEGHRCHFPYVKQGTWIGFFDGAKTITRFDGEDGREHVTFWRCFKTAAECKAWKYWVQTDYRAGPQVTWCRKK